MKYYCLQLIENDCGFACLKMLLAHFHGDKHYLMMKQELTNGSYSFAQLKQIGEQNDLFLKGYEVNKLEEINSFPCIALINHEKKNHYLIIEKIKNQKVYVFDPLRGKSEIFEEDFKKIFAYKILLKDSFKQRKCSYYFQKRLTNYPLIALIFNFFQVLFLFLTSFIKEDYLKILVIILMFLCLVITNRIINFILLKKYDQEHIYPVIKNNETKRVLTLEYNLKRDYFSYYQKMINQATILSVLGFILLLNDLKFAFVLPLLILIELFYQKIIFEKVSPLVFKINTLESKINLVSIKKADNLAYKIASFNNIIQIIRYFLIGISVFILCWINNNFLSFIYNFLLLIIIIDYYGKLIELRKQKLDLNKEVLLHLHNHK